MITASAPPVTSVSIPREVAEKVLTVGFRHRPYEGGIGYLIYVYEKYFGVFKYITTHRMVPNKLQLVWYFIGQYVNLLRTLIKDQSIRIVHIHGASYGSFYRKFIVFLTAKYLFGRQTIYHMNGSEFKVFFTESSPVMKNLVRFMVENTDVMLCLSESWKTFFEANFRMKRIEILGNVIDMPQRSTALTNPLGSGPLRVLFLGLIGNRKGIFDLLDVVRQHKADWNGKLELTIGGNGEVEKLQAFIEQHRLETIVRFEGWVSGDHKQKLLSESDVYILPSYNEGLPLSILEAMSYHLPVISTPVGGTAEAVVDGVNGYLVQPGDKQAIYERLNGFIENPCLVRQMGDESGYIIQRYLPDAIFPKLHSIYKDLLAQPQ
ncbi:glycosyltransferase family 4 protein [Spirosoma agri]|uniref:Glycosyltransferase family 4 protein n=1 Tax=Spirosoma agri TaxID=1987381 RepID=A0A6M0ILZ1_9BACT|nr:glycosyltransferase family 4 protein [Spirosoma agri]NEU69326.1 glycosyltransferase family 4 protein [Spirosoma agri]